MKYLIEIFCLICICAMSIIAQKPVEPTKEQFVEVPREIILPTIAVQPGCPLQFEKVVVLDGVGGGGITSYKLRNIGTKPIRRFTVANSFGSVFTWQMNSGELVMPGQLVPQLEDNRRETVPLTDELRKKLGMKNSMRGMVVFMVVNIEFSDGTKYNDEKTFKAMQGLFDDLDEAMNQYKRRVTNRP
ncbi:MAG: hypothetical protein H0V31_00935 [Acidobacteria bacterium]|nr:hypothetical protein [Acidobacteriota bacterium]MBA3633807.1 hypothetical protein [Acidobacteriota bacterium]